MATTIAKRTNKKKKKAIRNKQVKQINTRKTRHKNAIPMPFIHRPVDRPFSNTSCNSKRERARESSLLKKQNDHTQKKDA